MEFNTLTRRVASDLGADAGEATGPTPVQSGPAQYDTVFSEDVLEKWVAKAYERGVIAVDTETDSLNAMRANLVGVCLSCEAGKACYVPLGHGADGLALDDEDTGKQIKLERAIKILKPMLEDPAVLKIGQNMKYDALVLSRYGVTIAPFDDTMMISYALDCGRGGHGMDDLAKRHLDYDTIKFSDVAGTGKKAKTFDQIPIKEAAKYAAEDADIHCGFTRL